MKPIKFRARPALDLELGQYIDTGDNITLEASDEPYVYGTYYFYNGQFEDQYNHTNRRLIHIIASTESKVFEDTIDYFHDTVETEISPDTLAQFTGLLDKNTVEIYEGDRLLIHHFVMRSHKEYEPEDEEEFEATIKYFTDLENGVAYWGLTDIKSTYFSPCEGYEGMSLGGIDGLHEESYTVINKEM